MEGWRRICGGQDQEARDPDSSLLVRCCSFFHSRRPKLTLFSLYRDLFSYRALMWMQEKLFDLPVAFIARYVSDQMRKEVSLRNEAQNAERAAASIKGEPSLRDRVTIPKVYWDWTGESVMTAE